MVGLVATRDQPPPSFQPPCETPRGSHALSSGIPVSPIHPPHGRMPNLISTPPPPPPAPRGARINPVSPAHPACSLAAAAVHGLPGLPRPSAHQAGAGGRVQQHPLAAGECTGGVGVGQRDVPGLVHGVGARKPGVERVGPRRRPRVREREPRWRQQRRWRRSLKEAEGLLSGRMPG